MTPGVVVGGVVVGGVVVGGVVVGGVVVGGVVVGGVVVGGVVVGGLVVVVAPVVVGGTSVVVDPVGSPPCCCAETETAETKATPLMAATTISPRSARGRVASCLPFVFTRNLPCRSAATAETTRREPFAVGEPVSTDWNINVR